jgi:3-deoxy-7-phosphoheptulonate synthase
MIINTDDQRIISLRPLIPPAILIEDIPVDEAVSQLITASRQEAARIFRGEDDRLAVVVGPCSIHDTTAAIDYAEGLVKEAKRLEDDLLVIMRVYFEKPRTVVGWKGLINDPYIDNTFQINKGLRMARGLLHEIVEIGLPTATEFLDSIIPQFIADLVSWAAIGARTTESQIHRELASGLSMPVGFKNGTGGNVQMAIDAIRSSRHSHWFPSVTKQGVAAIFQTQGNQDAHAILRGGTRTGPNYDADSIAEAATLLEKADLPPYLMVDCSHANSGKDFRKQPEVATELGRQIENGSRAIAGIMLESNLYEGRQDYEPGKGVFGQSITDACLSFKDTVPVLEQLAKSVQARRKKNH